ncbi:MAG: hypothetical protein ABI789_06695 [Usitatibacter sp.]
MKTRTEIDAADLYVLLQREFRRRQSPDCANCFVQLPFRVDRHDTETQNWELVMPPQCASGCAAMLDELVVEYGMLYDLRTHVAG